MKNPHFTDILPLTYYVDSEYLSLIYAEMTVPQKKVRHYVSCYIYPGSAYAFVLNPKPLPSVANFLVVQKTGECLEWQHEFTSSMQLDSKLGCAISQNPMVLLTLNWENSLKRKPGEQEILKRGKADDSVVKALAVST